MNKALHPSSYPKRVMVAVTGLSPQIVTETLYALAVQQDPPFVPHQVILITTQEGARRAALELLDAHTGHFHSFCREYGLQGCIEFNETCIHVMPDAEGAPLDDIRSPEDNTAAADAITDLMRQLTADENSALHVSVAGGRKTMGFYLGYALTLFGRPQDRLSHVLVSKDFESLRDFFYPPKIPRVLHTNLPDKKPIRTDQAKITLAQIPFVPLRHGIPKTMLAGQTSYAEIVEATQANLAPPRLTLDYARHQVTCGSKVIELSPAHFAFFCWLAERRTRHIEGCHWVHWSNALCEEYLAVYRRVAGTTDSGPVERQERALKDGFTKEIFQEHKSRINKALKAQLLQAAGPYLIVRGARLPKTLYEPIGLTLAPNNIRFI